MMCEFGSPYKRPLWPTGCVKQLEKETQTHQGSTFVILDAQSKTNKTKKIVICCREEQSARTIYIIVKAK